MNVEIKTEAAQFLFGESRKSDFLSSVVVLQLSRVISIQLLYRGGSMFFTKPSIKLLY